VYKKTLSENLNQALELDNRELVRRNEWISRSMRRNEQSLKNEWELAEMGERHHLHCPTPTPHST
jgi:hypothetical protein